MIKVASRRMWGDAAIPESKSDNNPESLRLNALRILSNAWDTGALGEAPVTTANKRRLSTQEGGMRDIKRTKVVHFAPECL